jgi:hypothetical protein
VREIDDRPVAETVLEEVALLELINLICYFYNLLSTAKFNIIVRNRLATIGKLFCLSLHNDTKTINSLFCNIILFMDNAL